MGKARAGLSREARDALLAHSWPDNIRELQNAIERALILAGDELISAEHLGIMARAPRDTTIAATAAREAEAVTKSQTLAGQERHMIAEALRRAKGNKSRAAVTLGLSRTQLLRRVRRFGLDA